MRKVRFTVEVEGGTEGIGTDNYHLAPDEVRGTQRGHSEDSGKEQWYVATKEPDAVAETSVRGLLRQWMRRE